jgi:hypothetical protein
MNPSIAHGEYKYIATTFIASFMLNHRSTVSNAVRQNDPNPGAGMLERPEVEVGSAA